MSDFLWVEEYRPKTVDDCISTTVSKNYSLQAFIEKGERIKSTIYLVVPGVR